MPEIQDILIQYTDDYCRNHSVSYTHRKVLGALMKCRTSSLGGHVTECDECGHKQISYNSCRNRHCPKCQTLTKEKWIDHQKFNLLNVGYFHVVMTVPHTLHPVILQNQRVCYNLLFKAVAETLAELSADKKYLGAQTGFTGILHTWGQNLMFHPHIHCIVPGGGLNKLLQWIPSKKKFFLPVKVISRKFRGKFLALLKQAFIFNPHRLQATAVSYYVIIQSNAPATGIIRSRYLTYRYLFFWCITSDNYLFIMRSCFK